MSQQERPPTEEELRAALEDEMRRITTEEVIAQTVVSLVNLGARRAGLVPGAPDDVDLDQTRDAIDAVSALLPILERSEDPTRLAPIREALSQLQLAYARVRQAGPPAGAEAEAGGAPGEGGPGAAPAGEQPEGGAGPAQSSGRLWVPGQ